MDVTGTIKVWVNTYNGKTKYSYGIKVKGKNGEEKYAKQYIHFKGGDPGIENGDRIRVIKAFEGGYVDSEGKPRLGGITVLEWEPVDDPTEHGGFAALDEIVPF